MHCILFPKIWQWQVWIITNLDPLTLSTYLKHSSSGFRYSTLPLPSFSSPCFYCFEARVIQFLTYLTKVKTYTEHTHTHVPTRSLLFSMHHHSQSPEMLSYQPCGINNTFPCIHTRSISGFIYSTCNSATYCSIWIPNPVIWSIGHLVGKPDCRSIKLWCRIQTLNTDAQISMF